MNREQTIALFERCEAARAAARSQALSEGHSESEAKDFAHDAAKAVWNAWANERLDGCAARRALGASADDTPRNASNDAILSEDRQAWEDAARADFSLVRFLVPVSADEVRMDLGEARSRSPARLAEGSIALSGDEVDFSGFIFPGTADFSEAQFTVPARFHHTEFSGEACFWEAQFSEDACFHHTRFSGETRFDEARFYNKALFEKAVFAGTADFEKLRITREAWFEEAQFLSRARFGAAQFAGETRFHKVSFAGNADFTNTQFSGIAWFYGVRFAGEARFDKAQFARNAWFHDAEFASDGWFRGAEFFVSDFQKARFAKDVRFHQARFRGESDFRGAYFREDAWFANAHFSGGADFEHAHFARNAWFSGAEFSGDTRFAQVGFKGDVFFSKTRFTRPVSFRLTVFPNFVTFEGARFEQLASFNAIYGGRAFDLAGAAFDTVPDFVQAHFEESPRLDHLTITARLVPPTHAMGQARFWTSRWAYPVRAAFGVIHRVFRGDRDIPARWTALQRLAVRAHDQDRERAFFAAHIRARRFAGDWPLPVPVWSADGWYGFARFWLGIFYGLFSNYGRSVFLPVLWWFAAVTVGAMLYLGAHHEVRGQRLALREAGANWAEAYRLSSYAAWRNPVRCIVPGEDRVGMSALSPAVRQTTNAPKEAFDLALRTGLIVLDPGAANARRIYGCLYGLERFGETVAPVIPSRVSYITVMQKLFSVLMIFLFGLALRNMLRMK